MVLVSATEDKEEKVHEVLVTLKESDLAGLKFDFKGFLVMMLPSLIEALIQFLKEQNEPKES